MQADPVDTTAHDRILREHKNLKALLAQIEDALQTKSVSIDEVGRMLGELGDRLIRHFALEEQHSFFDDILTRAPRLVARANELLAQHPKMSRTADKLCQLASAKENAETWWQITAERFLQFKEELLLHEKEEDSLIQEVYHQDIGDND